MPSLRGAAWKHNGPSPHMGKRRFTPEANPGVRASGTPGGNPDELGLRTPTISPILTCRRGRTPMARLADLRFLLPLLYFLYTNTSQNTVIATIAWGITNEFIDISSIPGRIAWALFRPDDFFRRLGSRAEFGTWASYGRCVLR